MHQINLSILIIRITLLVNSSYALRGHDLFPGEHIPNNRREADFSSVKIIIREPLMLPGCWRERSE
jgi:hypothetical protein